MKVLLKSNKWSWKWDLRNKFDALNKHVLKLYKIQYTTKLTLFKLCARTQVQDCSNKLNLCIWNYENVILQKDIFVDEQYHFTFSRR